MTTGEGETLIRLWLLTRNARLVDARKKRGITSVAMAQKVDISPQRMSYIETLKEVPSEDVMIRIACVLEKPIDYLFPEEVLAAIKAGVFSRRKAELSGYQVIRLTQARCQELLTDGGLDEVEEEFDRKIAARSIQEVMTTLQPREQKVITLRFGLDGSGSRTLAEVGKKIGHVYRVAGERDRESAEDGVDRERVRQIEAKALRKLRHPTRSNKLKFLLD